ncbi:DUF1640-domain-containing protein [Apodospora peruviana]|uniref:DUF1640-domain-containing protein n=1 Tax=Apodospora peruviana TaxID=516989 RepID=A0AAE0IRP2_9PEZI|nr:DUF1640-domain-containing protein [Apodospora peruviana]
MTGCKGTIGPFFGTTSPITYYQRPFSGSARFHQNPKQARICQLDTMNSAQNLPKFLLPRTSWQSSLPPTVPRTASTVWFQSRDQQPQRQGRPAAGAGWQLSARPLHTRTAASPVRPWCSAALNSPSASSSSDIIAAARVRRPSSLRRSFHASAARRRDHHFDTLKFVQRLEEDGFTEEQSVAMMKVLNDVIEESIQNLTRTMVLREDAAKATYTQKVDFAKLRSELLSADSTEGNTTRAAHERLTNDIAKLSSRLRDEIGRTQASVRLDLNLEKGRIREEAVSQELKIKETETKIEQEVAALRQQLEQVKFQTLQWLMGVLTGFAALMLGAWRLLM